MIYFFQSQTAILINVFLSDQSLKSTRQGWLVVWVLTEMVYINIAGMYKFLFLFVKNCLTSQEAFS